MAEFTSDQNEEMKIQHAVSKDGAKIAGRIQIS